MSVAKNNKELILRMVSTLSGSRKDRDEIEQFVADESLVQHFLFFDRVFPCNELFIDELTAEGNRVIFRARMRGRHEGILDDMMPTYREIEFPMVFGFEIERNRIIHHWLIADQAMLIEQLSI